MKKSYLFTLITLLAFISSCKKDTSIGADILPTDDLLNLKFSDTFTLNVKTLEDTFLRTDKLAKNYLGVINDPLFGLQKSSIVFELDRPSTVLDDTLGPFTLDSVVLLLKYNSIYGDSTVAQSFEVSTINNKIDENIAYYSNNSAFPAGSTIGTLSSYTFQPSNKVIMSRTDTVGTASIMRIPLNASIGTTILNLGQNTLRDSTLFKNAFPGLRIENASNAGKCMAEMDLGSGNSSMVIYYKDKHNNQKEMRLFTSIYRVKNGSLVATPNGINLFSNTLSAAVQNVINFGTTSDSINYILGQGGTTVKISLPTVLNQGNIAVNKAELVVTQITPNSIKEFETPNFILLLKRNASGYLDILNSSDGIGLIDSTGIDNFGNTISRYKINISKYIQNVSRGIEANTDLYIATYRSGGIDGTVNSLNATINSNTINFGYTPYRVTIAGPNYADSRYKMKLNLTYTVIE